MKPTRLLPAIGLAALLAAAAIARDAGATIVERVVAVIGERPILWTELVRRAQAGRVQIRMQTRDPNVISVQEQMMYRELLDHMIDERLEEQTAERSHVGVSAEEIDRGIQNIAAQAQAQQGRPVTMADVMAEITHRGMTEQDFRDEIRRQILEGKLIELRVRPRVRVTDQDARAAYQHWVQETREKELVDVRTLVLRIDPLATPGQVQARITLAEDLAHRVRAGDNFCDLVAQFSDDASTRKTCGSRGPQPFAGLLQPLQDAVRSVAPGHVSQPIPIDTGQDRVVLLVMPMGRAAVQPFEEVQNEMMQNALLDGLERARKQWLQELRRNVYIDVRL
ncbi:MAG TPA: SurA N-terminal domain-containing protein [Polyangiaceae bacterium]|nr:SurA N-terminal domain-containing protein [Polyangiaceae bacterium]